MGTILIRWLISAAALVVTAFLVPGIRVEGNGLAAVLGTAVILGFLNAIIRPILSFLSCGLIVLTLGLFMFVINAIVLWLSSWIAVNIFHLGFYVDGLIPALLGSIVISLVTMLLSALIKGDKKMS